MIQEQKLNSQDLAEKLGVSVRTINRDIKAIKDDLELPVVFHKAENCFEVYDITKMGCFAIQ